MQGGYLEWQIRQFITRPIVAFRAYIFRDVLSQFDNLDDRAERVANEYYDQVTSQPAPEDFDGDLSGFAQDAHDEGLAWYQMMRSLRQSMLNLLAAGLYHLVEQQLALLCRDGGFRGVPPPEDTKLGIVISWYKQHLRLDLAGLGNYKLLDELRLVANTVKHGKGPACEELMKRRPELFTEPLFAKFLGGLGADEDLKLKVVAAPLAGDDVFVTEDLLNRYAEGAENLFREIGDHFAAHADEFYG
jgi:hypothetical protein